MGHFCPPGSGSGSGFPIRIRIHRPDWIRIQYGSGSRIRIHNTAQWVWKQQTLFQLLLRLIYEGESSARQRLFLLSRRRQSFHKRRQRSLHRGEPRCAPLRRQLRVGEKQLQLSPQWAAVRRLRPPACCWRPQHLLLFFVVLLAAAQLPLQLLQRQQRAAGAGRYLQPRLCGNDPRRYSTRTPYLLACVGNLQLRWKL